MVAVSNSTFRDRDWDVLLHSIEKGNCIPLLGPDLSITSGEDKRRNLLMELSRELAEILAEEQGSPVPDATNFSLVAQMFQNRLSRDELEMEVERFYKKHQAALLTDCQDTTFQNLAALPFSLFVTSRHDATLEHCLQKQGKQLATKSYQLRGDRRDVLGYLGTVEEPLIYQLYGAFDAPNSLVMTATDQLEFLKAVVSENPKLPADLTNLFGDKNFLFLGFGLSSYHFRVLLHVLGFSKSTKSFALENTPVAGAEKSFAETFNESVLVYGELGFNALKLLDTRLDEFIEQLCQRWENLHPGGHFDPPTNATSDATETEGEGPSVFISYVKEDEKRAQELFERLKKERLNPWIDTDGLRFGAKWDDTLEDTINDVDYFVVLQSRALSERVESYVYLEIDHALVRQKRRAEGSRFIFPVQLDQDVGRLDKLERAKIQTGTLYDWDVDVPRLAMEIRREHARQGRR